MLLANVSHTAMVCYLIIVNNNFNYVLSMGAPITSLTPCMVCRQIVFLSILFYMIGVCSSGKENVVLSKCYSVSFGLLSANFYVKSKLCKVGVIKLVLVIDGMRSRNTYTRNNEIFLP